MSGYSQTIVGATSDYQVPYEAVGSVRDFHALPRFGRSGEFSLLFSDSRGDPENYYMGLLFTACLIVSFFAAWSLLLLLFKCLGRHRVGVLSGNPYEKTGWWSAIGRSLFLVSGILVLIFSMLCVTKGLSNLEYTSHSVDATNNDAIKIRVDLSDISENLQTISGFASPVRDQLVSFLDADLCPLNPGNQLEDDIRSMGTENSAAIKGLAQFVNDELAEVDRALMRLERANDRVSEDVNEFNFDGPAAAAVIIPYMIIPVFLLAALLMGWFGLYSEPYYLFITWFILPIFVILIAVSTVAIGFGAVMVQGNSDFCYGGETSSPEGSIQAIFAQIDQETDSFCRQSISFYTNQCKESYENPWEFIENYSQKLAVANEALGRLSKYIGLTTAEQISQECGIDFGPALELVDQLYEYTSILSSSTERGIQLMTCENIVPLYTSVVYDSACKYSVEGATWVFASMFVMTFFSMVMIMFRGAYFPIYDFDFDDDEKSLGYASSEGDEDGVLSSSQYIEEEGNSILEDSTLGKRSTRQDSVQRR